MCILSLFFIFIFMIVLIYLFFHPSIVLIFALKARVVGEVPVVSP